MGEVTLKGIIAFILSISAFGYVGYDVVEKVSDDHYVVMKDVNYKSPLPMSDIKAQALKVGKILSESNSLSLVVQTNESGAKSLEKPGIIVEKVKRYGIPKPVNQKAFFGCGRDPAPQPPPAPSPQPSPNPGQETIDWGIERVHALQAFNKGIYGRQIKVCVLDTGIDMEHEDVRATHGYNFTTSDRSDFQDRQGHGTHTAGLVAAIFSNGKGTSGSSQGLLYIGKVLSDDGYGYNDWIANGMIWSVQQGCHIISMSLGGPDRSDVIESAIIFAKSRGVKILAAAGNDGSSDVGYPAGYNYPGTLYSVSATDKDDTLAYFSNFGKVEMACPGVDILSTVPGGYDTYSGTSMATPICAGVMALFMSQNKELVFDVIGSKTLFGEGIPNAGAL